MSVLIDLWERARSLVLRAREDRELDEELRFHVDMETEQQRRLGLSDAEAHRRSMLALGGMDRTKESVRDARGVWRLTNMSSDIAYALRGLRQRPGFTAVVVLTLALGIGGTTAVFSAVDAVLLQPLPYQQPGQLVRLYQSDTKDPGGKGFITPVHFLEIRRRMSSVQSIAAIMTYDEAGADIGSGDAVRRIRLLPTSADYFDVMRTQPAIGRAFQRDDETGAPMVVLSHALWLERFGGDAAAIGRPLIMSGKPYTVVGVMPDGFKDPIVGAVDAWVPADLTPGRDPSNSTNHYLGAVARLRNGVGIAAAQAELDAIMHTAASQYPRAKDALARLYPLKDDIVGSSDRALELMLGAVGLVLLLVCVNVANLLLVRGSERGREFAVRAALGAERGRIVRQVLIESVTLALVGDLAGLVVARIAMAGIVALARGTIPRLSALSLDWTLLAFSIAVSTISAMAFGAVPALRAARTAPAAALRSESRASTGALGAIRLREWLVVAQMAMAFVLAVGAALLLTSFARIRAVNLGVTSANVLTFELHLPAARYDSLARARFYEELASRTERLPGVIAAGGISKLPATGPYHQWGTQALSGPLANTRRGDLLAQQRVVSGDYFRVVGIPLLAGRMFDARDDDRALGRVLVSKTFADLAFPNIDPIGQRLNAGGRDAEVIGVVGDIAVNNEGSRDIYVYHAHRQFAGDRNWALTQVVATSGDPTSVESSIRELLASMDPQLVLFRPAPLDDVIGRGAAQRVFTLRMLGTFAAVAIALSAIGLFGVLSYGVKLRSREIGIRVALGAEQWTIRAMILRQGIGMAIGGVAIGIVGALALSRLMVSLVFHVSPLDPLVYATAALVMLVVAGIAAYVPSHRATSIDPRSALQ